MGFEEVCGFHFMCFRMGGNMNQFILYGNYPYVSTRKHIHVQRQIVVVRDSLEPFKPRIETINLVIVALYPDISVSIFFNIVQTVVAQSDAVARMGFIVVKCISVKFVETVPGSEPHHSFVILQNAHDGILRESVF